MKGRRDSSAMSSSKRVRFSYRIREKLDPFEGLPDDLVVSILAKVSSSSSRPSDFINALVVCKRFNRLGLTQLVLSKASPEVFAVKAKNWSESFHRFLKLCIAAGSGEACYFLGMIRFYCLENRESGASLMAKAAIRSHARAMYSLAVIQFNGSGGAKKDKDLRAGVALCARAASLGHIDSLRELGHCLQDGYGVRRSVSEGRRILVQANARELASALPDVNLASLTTLLNDLRRSKAPCQQQTSGCLCSGPNSGRGCGLLSDFGCSVPPRKPSPVNRFLIEWFAMRGREPGPGLRMCSYSGCGRPETRPHEFRRCSMCGTVNYCSRGCQAHDWKLRHKTSCVQARQWLNVNGNGGVGGGGEGQDGGVGQGAHGIVQT